MAAYDPDALCGCCEYNLAVSGSELCHHCRRGACHPVNGCQLARRPIDGLAVLEAGLLPWSSLPDSARESIDARVDIAAWCGVDVRDSGAVEAAATFRLVELPLQALNRNVVKDLADYDDCGIVDCDESHAERVRAMAAAIEAGAELPPIVIGLHPGRNLGPYLFDGFHRCAAHYVAGASRIRAYQLVLPAGSPLRA